MSASARFKERCPTKPRHSPRHPALRGPAPTLSEPPERTHRRGISSVAGRHRPYGYRRAPEAHAARLHSGLEKSPDNEGTVERIEATRIHGGPGVGRAMEEDGRRHLPNPGVVGVDRTDQATVGSHNTSFPFMIYSV